MPIDVTCECGASFAARDELAGKSIQCVTCGKKIKIPRTATAAAAGTPRWMQWAMLAGTGVALIGVVVVAVSVNSLSQRLLDQKNEVSANTEADTKRDTEFKTTSKTFRKAQTSQDVRLKQVESASQNALFKLTSQEQKQTKAATDRKKHQTQINGLTVDLTAQAKIQNDLKKRLSAAEVNTREVLRKIATEESLRKAAIAKAEKGFEAKVKAHDAQLKSLDTERARLVEAEKKIDSELTAANNKISGLEGQIADLNSRAIDPALLVSAFASLDARLIALNLKIGAGGAAGTPIDARTLAYMNQNRTGANPIALYAINTRNGRTTMGLMNNTYAFFGGFNNIPILEPVAAAAPTGQIGRYDLRILVDNAGDHLNTIRFDRNTGNAWFLDLPTVLAGAPRWKAYTNASSTTNGGRVRWSISVRPAVPGQLPQILITDCGTTIRRVLVNRGLNIAFVPR